MLITILNSKQVWQSPDGQIKIWDFDGVYPDNQEKVQGQTRSGKIASALNQTLDLTTTVSKSGKTYFVQVPREGNSTWNSSQSSLEAAGRTQTPERSTTQVSPTQRFEQAVERFEKAVDKLLGKDITPTDKQIQEVAEFMGGEVVDDL